MLIIDDASQCCEATTLIPILSSGAKKIITVGDTLQLGPVIKFPGAKLLEVSFFKRLIFEKKVINVELNTPMRMNPTIADFISINFYNGSIMNASITNNNDIVFPTENNNKSIIVYNMDDEQSLSGNSYSNYK